MCVWGRQNQNLLQINGSYLLNSYLSVGLGLLKRNANWGYAATQSSTPYETTTEQELRYTLSTQLKLFSQLSSTLGAQYVKMERANHVEDTWPNYMAALSFSWAKKIIFFALSWPVSTLLRPAPIAQKRLGSSQAGSEPKKKFSSEQKSFSPSNRLSQYLISLDSKILEAI